MTNLGKEASIIQVAPLFSDGTMDVPTKQADPFSRALMSANYLVLEGIVNACLAVYLLS